jgi:muramoyltetrapeptide carboxypeptidase LdcA involved in peptidoglycan recycling
VTFSLLNEMVKTKKGLANIPVIGNADFGHTDPKITFPVGGTVSLKSSRKHPEITILEH